MKCCRFYLQCSRCLHGCGAFFSAWLPLLTPRHIRHKQEGFPEHTLVVFSDHCSSSARDILHHMAKAETNLTCLTLNVKAQRYLHLFYTTDFIMEVKQVYNMRKYTYDTHGCTTPPPTSNLFLGYYLYVFMYAHANLKKKQVLNYVLVCKVIQNLDSDLSHDQKTRRSWLTIKSHFNQICPQLIRLCGNNHINDVMYR